MLFNRLGGKLIFTLFILSFLSTVNAQNPDRCGTVDAQNALLQKDPTLAAHLAQVRAQMQQYAASHPTQSQRSVITIPVVVHVVSNGEAIGIGTNISDAQVLSEIDVLNADYRRMNADTGNTPSVFQPLAADIEIEFCMAVRDPQGNPTTGIDRINGHQASWTQVQVDGTLKPASVWDRDQYLNIWTLKLGGASAGILGYAIMPGNPANVDGVVIGSSYFGNTGNVLHPYDKGRTSTHEIGHWLGLFHPWSETSPTTNTSCTDDDGCNDTPKTSGANYGCPTFPHVSCNNGPNGDMFMDYMDYVDDNCMNMFTKGQKTLMYAALNGPRSSILTSLGCTRYDYDVAMLEVRQPGSQVCDGNFSPLVKIANEGSSTLTTCLINIIIDSGNVIQYNWSGNLASGQTEFVTLDPINLSAGPHNMQLFVNGPNNHADQNPSNDGSVNAIFFNVGVTAPGDNLPMSENFEEDSLLHFPLFWTRDSTGADTIRWAVSSAAGEGGSFRSLWINNFKGTVTHNSKGFRDGAITDGLFISNAKYPHLTFDVAYAQKDSATQDSLIVSYSLDCGGDWFRIYAKGGPSLRTAIPQITSFIPTASDWRHEDIEVPEVTNQDHVEFRFQSYSDWGNNIYVDNVNVNAFRVGINEVTLPTIGVVISPNPNDGRFTASFDHLLPEHSTIEVYDLLGRQVFFNGNISGNSATIDMSGRDAGIYLAKITSGTSSIVKKVVVN